MLVSLGFASMVITATVATIAILYTMFTTPEDNIRKEGLFGSVFFQTKTPDPDGATALSLGVANPVPLIIICVGVFIFLVLFARTYTQLKRHRQGLLVDAGDR